jgi:cell division ATPase FtsA
MVELGEDIFLKPVRIGVPEYAGGLADVVRNPRYSTAMGLWWKDVRNGCAVARWRCSPARWARCSHA